MPGFGARALTIFHACHAGHPAEFPNHVVGHFPRHLFRVPKRFVVRKCRPIGHGRRRRLRIQRVAVGSLSPRSQGNENTQTGGGPDASRQAAERTHTAGVRRRCRSAKNNVHHKNLAIRGRAAIRIGKSRRPAARDSGGGDSRRTLGTVGNKSGKRTGDQWDCHAGRKRRDRRNEYRRNRQRRSHATRRTMLAVVLRGLGRRLFRLVARGCRLIGHRHARRGTRRLVRKCAAQHRRGRKGLHRQHQHHQDQQESLERKAHAASVPKSQNAQMTRLCGIKFRIRPLRVCLRRGAVSAG